MKVNYSQITTKNFRVGDIVYLGDDQYEIIDAESGKAHLRKLAQDELVKGSYVIGHVLL